MMRCGLEAQLLYAAPRELLLLQPLSAATQHMLDGFCSASAGVRSESVKRDLLGPGGALAAVSAFYGEAGELPHLHRCVTEWDIGAKKLPIAE